jgi:hypothetical protein
MLDALASREIPRRKHRPQQSRATAVDLVIDISNSRMYQNETDEIEYRMEKIALVHLAMNMRDARERSHGCVEAWSKRCKSSRQSTF